MHMRTQNEQAKFETKLENREKQKVSLQLFAWFSMEFDFPLTLGRSSAEKCDKGKCDMSTRTRPTISANFAKSHSGGVR